MKISLFLFLSRSQFKTFNIICFVVMWLHICKLDALFLIEGEGLYPICGTCEYPCTNGNKFVWVCGSNITRLYNQIFRVFIKWNFVIYFRVLHIHNLFCLYFKLIMEWMQWLQFPAQHFVMKVLHILVSNFLILEKFLLFLLLALSICTIVLTENIF